MAKVRRKKWADKDIAYAMKDVHELNKTISSAARRRYKVPRKTLEDRVKGRVQLS